METVLYALASSRDPGNIRYIGKTVRPLAQRLADHVKRRNSRQHHVSRWIQREIREGFEILIVEIDRVHGDAWKQREIDLIAEYRVLFDLTNILPGGQYGGVKGAGLGRKMPRSAVEASTAAKRGKPRTKETREKLSLAITEAWANPEKRRNFTAKKRPPSAAKHFTSDGRRGCAVAAENGITRSTFMARVLHGWSVDDAAGMALREWPNTEWRQVAAANGIVWGTFNARVRRGWPAERAATVPPGPNGPKRN